MTKVKKSVKSTTPTKSSTPKTAAAAGAKAASQPKSATTKPAAKSAPKAKTVAPTPAKQVKTVAKKPLLATISKKQKVTTNSQAKEANPSVEVSPEMIADFNNSQGQSPSVVALKSPETNATTSENTNQVTAEPKKGFFSKLFSRKPKVEAGNDSFKTEASLLRLNSFTSQQQRDLFENAIAPNNDRNLEKVIELKGLKKSFGKGAKRKNAVQGIDITFFKGENVGFLGSNGAGKTVTIEMISGIQTPDEGKITYNFPYIKSFHEGLGIQFQDSSYPDGITTKDVIDFMMQAYKFSMPQSELDLLLSTFGVKSFYRQPAKSLSGGQMQRLNIILSLLHRPKVLILDELTTGLDIEARLNIKNFIEEYIKKHQITLILISHDMDEVQHLCDRIVILKKGKIVADQMKDEVLKVFPSVSEFVEKFLM